MPGLSLHLRILRRLLQKLNYHLAPLPAKADEEPFDESKLRGAETALRELLLRDEGSRHYLAKHISRLARTLALVPPPESSGRVLELGCYMQITPLLSRLCGYREVRGGYFGKLGEVDHKIMRFPDGDFSADIAHFDAERDSFPFPDEYFELVIAGEIIEHLRYDPMHLLLESRRVLRDRGTLILSTPNVGSIASVGKALDGRYNPQIFSLYERPVPGGDPEIGHVREYTAHEIGDTIRAAGFEIEQLFTTFISEFSSYLPLLQLLAQSGYSIEHRGEQTWCVARKNSALPTDRFPWFLYSP